MPGEVENTLQERESTHGSFADCAQCSWDMLQVARRQRNWERLSPVQHEALHMMIHKMHRILCGDCDNREHWLDNAGYATLVVQWLDARNQLQLKTQSTTSISGSTTPVTFRTTEGR